MSKSEKTIARYLERHAVPLPTWTELPDPSPQLAVCVVIPAYDELETIEEVLLSLDINKLVPEQVEILICVNNTTDASPRAKEANLDTIERLQRLKTPFALHVIDRAGPGRAFAADAGGVGHARRLLMDTATARLFEVGRSETGLIACLDGDSPADPGYLDDVFREMTAARRPGTSRALAGVCHYRHPIPEDEDHARAIITYETWMRYFEAALQFVGTPYAFQSIGSCMVLTARGYARADGVRPREALSDFYMLQKIVKTGGRGSVIQLQNPLVRPSARPSERVPRGTGPSVRASMTPNPQERARRFEWVEPPRAFIELRHFFFTIEEGFSHPDALREAASPFLTEIIERWGGWTTIDSLREHAPDAPRFERQFHTYFDSLKLVKFANRSREKWGGVHIFDAITQLQEAGALPHDLPPHHNDPRQLLEILRTVER